MALLVLLVARHLAHQHDMSSARTFAENGLRGVLVQIAALAVCGGRAKGTQVQARRQKIFSRGFGRHVGLASHNGSDIRITGKVHAKWVCRGYSSGLSQPGISRGASVMRVRMRRIPVLLSFYL